MRMKYLVLKEEGCPEELIMFPGWIKHNDMRDRFPNHKVISGGFFSYTCNDDYFGFDGEAQSLRVKSREEDRDLFHRAACAYL